MWRGLIHSPHTLHAPGVKLPRTYDFVNGQAESDGTLSGLRGVEKTFQRANSKLDHFETFKNIKITKFLFVYNQILIF
jgi:hypothetical protein